MMRIVEEDTYHLTQLHLSETVSKPPRNYFCINKVAVVDKWSMWWKEIVVSVSGGYWRRAVTEIKMRWKGFSWWKMTLAKLVHFRGRVGVGVPSCQDMLYTRLGYQIHFSFVENAVKGTDNTIKPMPAKPIESFRSQTLRAPVFIGLVPCTQLLITSAVHRSSMAWLMTLRFYLFHITSALLSEQWKQSLQKPWFLWNYKSEALFEAK